MSEPVYEFSPGAWMEFAEDPKPQRIRIEIVADQLDVVPKIDYEADMAYIKVRDGDRAWNDVKQEDRSLILDYDSDDQLLGIEIFLVRGAILLDTVAALTRLLRDEG